MNYDQKSQEVDSKNKENESLSEQLSEKLNNLNNIEVICQCQKLRFFEARAIYHLFLMHSFVSSFSFPFISGGTPVD